MRCYLKGIFCFILYKKYRKYKLFLLSYFYLIKTDVFYRMSTPLKILSSKDIQQFDSPPMFSGEERKRFFILLHWEKEILETLRSPSSQVGFILRNGYFRASNKFFIAHQFHSKDIEFVCNRLGVEENQLQWENSERTLRRHKTIILHYYGFCKFDDNINATLWSEAFKLCEKQIKPRLIFLSLMDFLRNKKIEVPRYSKLAEIISNSLKNFEQSLFSKIDQHLSVAEKILLDQLLEVSEEYVDGDKQDAKIKRYKITLLKKINQSTKPSSIKETIGDFQTLYNLYQKIAPILKSIELSTEVIQYYAQVVIRSRGFQINRRKKHRYLLLISFIAHQYYFLNDVLIEVLMKSVQSSKNTCEREYKDSFYEQRKSSHLQVNQFTKNVQNYLATVDRARLIVQNKVLSVSEKVVQLQVILSNDFKAQSDDLRTNIDQISNVSSKIAQDLEYYNFLEKRSVKLQNRVSERDTLSLPDELYTIVCSSVSKKSIDGELLKLPSVFR